jgi:hypothetical protein
MLSDILTAAFDGPVNQFFTFTIIALSALAMAGLLTRTGPLYRLAGVAPGLLTALGVLGTFVGILLGLIGFNVADVAQSVPQLLEGMKTAFVTSVFGMGSGIFVKVLSEVLRREAVVDDAKGVEDVLSALDALRREGTSNRTEVVAALERVRAGLTGDAESSLVTQLQRLRTDVTDDIRASADTVRREGAQSRTEVVAALERVRAGLTGDAESSLVTQLQRLRTDVTDEIRTSRKATSDLFSAVAIEIQKISTTLTENTSKAIIEALERSIKEFNEKISEQFGENFRQLNTAVGRLLEWQDNYRQQMIANAEALREGALGIQASREGIEAIGVQSSALVRAAGDMQSLLDGIAKTTTELDARLGAFRDMADKASAAMPTIQTRIEELTTGFSREVEAASARVNDMAQALQSSMAEHEQSLRAASTTFVQAVSDASSQAATAATRTAAEQTTMLKGLSDGYSRLRDDAATVGADLKGAIQEAGDGLRRSLVDAAAEMQKTSSESIRSVSQQLQNTTNDEFRRIANSLDDQIKQLDEAMARELERALSALGSQLVSLTGKFVEDYTILTGRLRDAVNATRRDQA